MVTRDKLRRLQKALSGNLKVIDLADGTRFCFDPQKVFEATFKYLSDSLRADYDRKPRPEPPDVLKAVANAKNRRAALNCVMAGSSFLPVDEEALVERGEFVPRSLVAGRTYPDFSGLEDLGEKPGSSATI